MCALRLISSSIPRVAEKTFSRKYMAIGRIITYWPDIIGADLANKTQPIKINYRKTKRRNEKPQAVLSIAATSSICSLLIMKKGVLLEKINQIFGDQWITDIRFVHIPANQISGKKTAMIKTEPNQDQKNLLTSMLGMVEDLSLIHI